MPLNNDFCFTKSVISFVLKSSIITCCLVAQLDLQRLLHMWLNLALYSLVDLHVHLLKTTNLFYLGFRILLDKLSSTLLSSCMNLMDLAILSIHLLVHSFHLQHFSIIWKWLPCKSFCNHRTTRNPHSPDRYTGGSSSGPAAIVASGLCSAALGTDGGGWTINHACFNSFSIIFNYI